MVFMSMNHLTTIPGVLVAVHGIGVLIRGRSGSGKSLAAFHLMRNGHKLIADDLVVVEQGDAGHTVGRSVATPVLMEVRGLGVFEAESVVQGSTAPCWPIHLVVYLDEYEPSKDLGRTSPETSFTSILGSALTQVRVPLTLRSDPAAVIELLVNLFRNHVLVTTP
jgi:HPr kinase/phosphorylase